MAKKIAKNIGVRPNNLPRKSKPPKSPPPFLYMCSLYRNECGPSKQPWQKIFFEQIIPCPFNWDLVMDGENVPWRLTLTGHIYLTNIIKHWGPKDVHLKHRDSPYVVHFICRDFSYVIHLLYGIHIHMFPLRIYVCLLSYIIKYL